MQGKFILCGKTFLWFLGRGGCYLFPQALSFSEKILLHLIQKPNTGQSLRIDLRSLNLDWNGFFPFYICVFLPGKVSGYVFLPQANKVSIFPIGVCLSYVNFFTYCHLKPWTQKLYSKELNLVVLLKKDLFQCTCGSVTG